MRGFFPRIAPAQNRARHFLAQTAGAANIARMSATNRTDAIEQTLIASQELDLDTCAFLAEADGHLAEAEAVFQRLAEPARQPR